MGEYRKQYLREMEGRCGEYSSRVRGKRPLVHLITNYVTVTDCVNAVLAIGGRAICSHALQEAAQVASSADALVCNLGGTEYYEAMDLAAAQADSSGIPLVIDPAGCAASDYRLEKCIDMIRNFHPAAIRGNYEEIDALLGAWGATGGQTCGEVSRHENGTAAARNQLVYPAFEGGEKGVTADPQHAGQQLSNAGGKEVTADPQHAGREISNAGEKEVTVDPQHAGLEISNFGGKEVTADPQHAGPQLSNFGGKEVTADPQHAESQISDSGGLRPGRSRGLDSVSLYSFEERAELRFRMKVFSKETGTILIASGADDLCTDGRDCIELSCGTPALHCITGSGCMETAVLAAFLAVENSLRSAQTAMRFFALAGEAALASCRETGTGAGHFHTFLMDALASGDPIWRE